MAVRQDAVRLAAATGHPADLNRLGATRWRLTMSPHPGSTGARLQLDYSPNGRGVIRDPKAHLTDADGRLCKPPKDFYAFLQVYYCLDQDQAFPRDTPTAMPNRRPTDQAPPAVRTFCTILAARLPEHRRLSLGHSADSGWVLGIDDDHSAMRLFLAPATHGSGWGLNSFYSIQVVAGGRDLSAQTAGNFAKAVRILEKARTARPSSSSSTISASVGPAVTTSTQVRDNVVMRV